MCMCAHMGMRPAPFGYRIAELQVGDEVSIKAGAGNPKQESDTVDIVFHVSGISALTATGIKLMCTDGVNVEPTGQRFEPGTFEVSEQARAILVEAEA